MNILYCVPGLYNPGGMERILTDKANYLSDIEGYNIHIITTDQENKSIYFQLSSKIKITHLNLDFNSYFNEPLLKKAYYIKRLQRRYKNILEDYCRKERIDVIVSLGGKELDFLYKLNVNCKKICELHFSISIREQFLLARGNNLKNRIIGKFRNSQLLKQTKLLDHLVVLTKSDEEKLKHTHKNVTQIYNFTSFSSTKTNLDNKIVIGMGKLDPQKGFDLLIESCKYIKNWHGWRIEVYGKGPDREILESKVKEYDLEQYVYFKGVAKNVEEVYEKASMFVLPSRYEGFPMVLVEALSFGLPIVSFDCETGPNEIIKDNDCGILVENGNVKKLGEALETMFEDKDKLIDSSIQSLMKCQEFSKESIMNQWLKIFNQ